MARSTFGGASDEQPILVISSHGTGILSRDHREEAKRSPFSSQEKNKRKNEIDAQEDDDIRRLSHGGAWFCLREEKHV